MNYYDRKQKKRLHSFKQDLIAIVILIVIGIGYECWIHNHFLLYCLAILIIFLGWFGYGMGRNNKECDKIFDEDNNDLKT